MIVAVVPLKGRAHAKSRLAGTMAPGRRERLALELAARTVRIVAASPRVHRVALATPETALAVELGVELLPDRGSLNGAIEDAQRWAGRAGAGGLLVVPADLPLLQTAEIDDLVSGAPPGPSLTIAGTRDGGTGCLLLSPPETVRPLFGAGSFARHLAAAREAGVRLSIVERRGFTHDLDTVDDLVALRANLL